MSTLIFGHQNPDTDSVMSAIAFSHLKNKLGFDTTPCVLGSLRKEAKFVLDYFKINEPTLVETVKTQVKDLNYNKVCSINPNSSILSACKLMENSQLRTLAVTDENNKLLGIVTMKDIALSLLKGDFNFLNTSLNNISSDLNGTILHDSKSEIKGDILAISYEDVDGILSENNIIIIGDRLDIIDYAISCNVKLIIVTGNKDIPKKYVDKAKNANVAMISVTYDTYMTSKLINECNYVSSIMKSCDLIKFNENEFVEDIKSDISKINFRNYPIINNKGQFMGFLGKNHLLNPSKKQVILMDHNEFAQSVDGIKDAQIIEIVDHHKIGGITTDLPINFRCSTVGSTCTIVYNMFKENNIEIPNEIAGLLLSGILSDTLIFKSPTTTDVDKDVSNKIAKQLNIDINKYGMDMFKAGTSLNGCSIEDIVYMDFKEFTLGDIKSGIGQVTTLDIDTILNRQDEFLNFINKEAKNKGYSLMLLAITDIIQEGSYLIYTSDNENIVTDAFNIDNIQGSFVPGLVSRKKQIVPKLLKASSK